MFFIKKHKIRLVQIPPALWSRDVSHNLWRDFRLLVSAFAAVALKGFNGKSYEKYVFGPNAGEI